MRLLVFILELALELWCPWPLPSFTLLSTQRRGTTGLSTGSEYLVLVWAAQSTHVRNAPQVTRIYWRSCVHLLSKKPGEGNHYFLKRKQKQKSARVLQKKTASHTWNVTRMGFQLKHGKPLMSVTAMTLDSAPSFVLGRAKQKWWADKQGQVSFNKNSLLKKRKIEHSRFLFTITPPPPPPQFYLTLCCIFYFVFQVTFQEKVIFFFSQQYLTIPWDSIASKP